MKIKFKSELAMRDFVASGLSGGDYYHNQSIAETYQMYPFHVDVTDYGWENKEYYISHDEYEFFEIISES